MELILIRHGQTDYAPCLARGFIGHGHNLGALTPKGVAQAKTAALSPLLKGAQIIVASPYTRALQTAAYVAQTTGLDIVIEHDLREWEPDLSYTYADTETACIAAEEYMLRNGMCWESRKPRWENACCLRRRALNCLKPYAEQYDKIIAVTHSMVMQQFIPHEKIRLGSVWSLDFERLLAAHEPGR